MNSEELARPVVQITNFHTGDIEYEIYTFGEQIVVIPLADIPTGRDGGSPVHQHAQEALSRKLHRLFHFDFLLSVKGDKQLLLYVPARNKAAVIGSGGSKIQTLEEEIGMSISVKSFDELPLRDERFRTTVGSKNNRATISFETIADEKIHLIV
jgi:ATPase